MTQIYLIYGMRYDNVFVTKEMQKTFEQEAEEEGFYIINFKDSYSFIVIDHMEDDLDCKNMGPLNVDDTKEKRLRKIYSQYRAHDPEIGFYTFVNNDSDDERYF